MRLKREPAQLKIVIFPHYWQSEHSTKEWERLNLPH